MINNALIRMTLKGKSIYTVSLTFALFCNPSGPSTPDICLSVFPQNGGTIIPSQESFIIGDTIELKAVPFGGHYFYQWYGVTISFDTIIKITVTEEPKSYGVVFPDTVIADGKIIIGNFPDKTVKIGEFAVFELGIDFPLDSTYTVSSICNDFDNFTFSMHCKGNELGILVGCRNDSPTIQDEWTISISSDKSDSFIVNERVNYTVEWK